MQARVKVTGIQRPCRPPTHRRPAALLRLGRAARPSRCNRSAWCSPRLQTSHAERQLPPRNAPLRAAPRLSAQHWARPCRARNNGLKLRPCCSSDPPAPLQSAPTIPQSRPCGPADLRAQPQCHRMAKCWCRRQLALTPPRRLERRLHDVITCAGADGAELGVTEELLSGKREQRRLRQCPQPAVTARCDHGHCMRLLHRGSLPAHHSPQTRAPGRPLVPAPCAQAPPGTASPPPRALPRFAQAPAACVEGTWAPPESLARARPRLPRP